LRAGVLFGSLPSMRHSGADSKFRAPTSEIVLVRVDFP
jgi:hypothetical protein